MRIIVSKIKIRLILTLTNQIFFVFPSHFTHLSPHISPVTLFSIYFRYCSDFFLYGCMRKIFQI